MQRAFPRFVVWARCTRPGVQSEPLGTRLGLSDIPSLFEISSKVPCPAIGLGATNGRA